MAFSFAAVSSSSLFQRIFEGRRPLPVRCLRRRALHLECLEDRTLPSFLAPANYPTGPSPAAVAVGDFTGHGIPDLVVAANDGVSLRVGNGDGTFQLARTLAPLPNPTALVVADLTGNGKLDIVACNYSTSSTVMVLLGNGDGTFQAPQSISITGGLEGLAVGDFNGDHILDLVVTNYDHGTVSVLLGNGDGTFQVPRNLAVPSPFGVAVGDFNGDSHQDLVVTSTDLNQVYVFLGNGDGTFQSPQTFNVGYNPQGVVVADFTGTGTLDLAVANAGGFKGEGSISVLRGNGDGTFRPAVTYENIANFFAIAVGDFNGDHRPDLVAEEGVFSKTTTILLNNGDGTFQVAPSLPAGSDPVAVAVADLNRDGTDDLIVVNQISNDLDVFLGRGDGTFVTAPTYNTGGNPAAVAVGDFNGDGIPDLAVANLNGSTGTVGILLGNGDGTFQPARTYAVGSGPDSIAVADLTGNGILDIVVTNSGVPMGGTTVSVLLGNGDGTFQPARTFTTGGITPTYVVIGDFTNDGIPDLVVHNNGPRGGTASVTLLIGNGDGTFQGPQMILGGLRQSSGQVVGAADFNNDGNLDIAVAESTPTVRVLLGNGDGTFQAPLSVTAPGSVGVLAIGDVNGDNVPDLLLGIGTGTQASVAVLLGNGDGTFQLTGQYATEVGIRSMVLADVNGDGNVDLAVTSQAGVGIFLGNGDGSFQSPLNYFAGSTPFSVAAGDFNGDGFPDLAVADVFDANVSILLNAADWGGGGGGAPSPSHSGKSDGPAAGFTGLSGALASEFDLSSLTAANTQSAPLPQQASQSLSSPAADQSSDGLPATPVPDSQASAFPLPSAQPADQFANEGGDLNLSEGWLLDEVFRQA